MANFFSDPQVLANFNNMIHETTSDVLCTPSSECGKAKISADLEKKYIESKVNLQTAPLQLDDSERNYYLYTKGPVGYNKFLVDKLNNTANAETSKMTMEFNENIKRVSQMNDTLNSLSINYANELDLYDNYVIKNGLVKRRIDNHGSDIITKDRKTYYEQDNYDYLVWWYRVWFFIYALLWVVFAVGIFLANSTFPLKTKILLLTLLLAYPFVIDSIAFFFIKLFVKMASYIPKNAYLDTY